ncbi:hypothetical protein [Romboutsia sp.]|uniref:hypothetical protein n=1 Tax=Romboutsia sp. TaxID=1965302 RepID=UPI002CAA27D4|nr:hypothetical protein [Romboutsia sp.]HSQ87999.1 hypothetical protein [Romboutsia sp.]
MIKRLWCKHDWNIVMEDKYYDLYGYVDRINYHVYCPKCGKRKKMDYGKYMMEQRIKEVNDEYKNR